MKKNIFLALLLLTSFYKSHCMIGRSRISFKLLVSDLFSAAKGGCIRKIRSCICTGVNIKTKDKTGKTPLEYAVENSHTKTIALIEKYIDNSNKLINSLNDFKKRRENTAAYLQQIKELLTDKYTPQYDKQTAIKVIFEYLGAIDQELCKYIIFNERFLTDKTFKTLLRFLAFSNLKDRDGKDMLDKINYTDPLEEPVAFTPSKDQATKIRDLYEKGERFKFGTKQMQKHCVNLQNKRLLVPKFLFG